MDDPINDLRRFGPWFAQEFVRGLPDIWYKDKDGKETKERCCDFFCIE